MGKFITRGAILALGIWAIPLGGFAQEIDPARFDALRADSVIHEGLLAISVGRLIRNHCDRIDARRFAVIAFAENLVRRGHDLGYSRAEMEAYIDSEADRDRYRALARAYLADQGANIEDAQSMCRLGEVEISSRSVIGRLLREG